MRYVMLAVLALLTFSATQAQSKKKKKKKAQQEQFEQFPSSRDPGNSDNLFKGERKRGKSATGRYGSLEAKAVQNFQKRMKDNAKKYKKIEKMKQKPQYSDPSYFGHKRKPKKRPVGKRKLCKECGIVH